MRIGVPKERQDARVAATPKTVTQLQKLGFSVAIEAGAGQRACFEDAAYLEAGAEVVEAAQVWASSLILKVNPPQDDEVVLMQPGTTLIGFIWPLQNAALLQQLQERQINVLAMDCVPRISRAQSMDALSAMGNIAGYRAIVEAAHEFGRFFTGQITAAGKIPPAKVMVIGAGVAGLAAIGAAGSMGAIVRAFDVRPEVKEQIESMGAQCLELKFEGQGANGVTGGGDGYAKVMPEEFLKAELALFAQQAKEVDIIVTTALIPGKPAPKLITAEMVASMKPGSVIVDLAAQNGGNCDLTQAEKMVETPNSVKIIGYTDLPSRLPTQSSQLYATNLVNLLGLLCKEKNGEINLDFEDVVIHSVTVVKDGQRITPPEIQVSAQPQAQPRKTPVAARGQKHGEEKSPGLAWKKYLAIVIAAGLFGWLARVAPVEFLSHFTVFALACIVGYYVVWNVSHALHTPLMSVTNAISGIIVVGALIQIGQGNWLVNVLSFIAILMASINVFGGFWVTQRMLKMFSKK